MSDDIAAAALPPGLKLGALINPNSRRNRKRMPDLTPLETAGVPIEIPENAAAVPAALERLANAEIDLLAISGGDGAIQAAMTAILLGGGFPKPPTLALIPGGTTNMTAADVGFRIGRDPFARLLERTRAGGGRIAERAALKLDVADATPPQAGMFFGGIAIVRAIHLCRRHIHSRGVVGGLANWLTLAPLLLSGKSGGVLAGEAADVRVGETNETLPGPLTLMMASTLDRLALGARPFWGADADGDVAATFIASPPRRLLRNAPGMLYGWTGRPREPHYMSRYADSFEIAYSGEVTLDGELYQAARDRPMRLSSAGRLRFLTR